MKLDKMERNEYIDIVKGIAIVLVVVGHAIQYTCKDYDSIFVFRIIYSFHMPLFIFISGLLVGLKYDSTSFDIIWIREKFITLIVPFLFWPAILSATKKQSINIIFISVWETIKQPAIKGGTISGQYFI